MTYSDTATLIGVTGFLNRSIPLNYYTPLSPTPTITPPNHFTGDISL